MAQELLSTFENDLDGVKLKPGKGGVFEIYIGDERIFSREEKKRFPQIKELKQLVRDKIDPERDLGHIDR